MLIHTLIAPDGEILASNDAGRELWGNLRGHNAAEFMPAEQTLAFWARMEALRTANIEPATWTHDTAYGKVPVRWHLRRQFDLNGCLYRIVSIGHALLLPRDSAVWLPDGTVLTEALSRREAEVYAETYHRLTGLPLRVITRLRQRPGRQGQGHVLRRVR